MGRSWGPGRDTWGGGGGPRLRPDLGALLLVVKVDVDMEMSLADFQVCSNWSIVSRKSERDVSAEPASWKLADWQATETGESAGTWRRKGSGWEMVGSLRTWHQ